MYYYRHRFYDSQLGRFLSRDPSLYDGSRWNLYAYVNNSPLAQVDPSGLVLGRTHVIPSDYPFCRAKCKRKGMVSAGVTLDSIQIGLGFVLHRRNRHCRPTPENCGNCTPQQMAYLKGAQDKPCKGAGKPKMTMTCKELWIAQHKNTACAAARQAIVTKCFNGIPTGNHGPMIQKHLDYAKESLRFRAVKGCPRIVIGA